MDKFDADCVWHVLNPTRFRNLPYTEHITRGMYYRFVAADYFYGKTDRILYLDSDTICRGSLHGMYTVPLAGKLVAAVRREWGCTPEVQRHLGLATPEYFNSGVLLINVPEYHRQRITERAVRLLLDNPYRYGCPDQDVLNILCQKQVRWLPRSCNVYNDDVVDWTAAEAPNAIIHYLTAEKPWSSQYHRSPETRQLWLDCKARSAWADVDMTTHPQ